ncbi:MAG: YceH family protein [Phycisphaerae bacterium]
MSLTLDALERRVLGVLMEKSLTQPEYYPMTPNAIVAGCNQKNNRDPEMKLDEESVLRTLESLRARNLVTLVLPAPGARSQRYRHNIEATFGWSRRQQAIITELLLRGPQTPGELRSRCARMFEFESLDALMTALNSLSKGESDPPFVAAMPREPGQSATRYTHLLYPEDEAPPTAATSPTDRPAQTVPRPSSSSAAASLTDDLSMSLQQEMDALQEEIAGLHEEMAELRRRLEAVENKTAGL